MPKYPQAMQEQKILAPCMAVSICLQWQKLPTEKLYTSLVCVCPYFCGVALKMSLYHAYK